MNESRIQQLRVARGWTQERLAAESGVAVRTIQRLESGKDANLETVALLAAALDVPATELFGTVERPSFETAIDGLEERTATQQTRRDATVRAWRSLYTAVGVAVTILFIVLTSTRSIPGVAFLFVGLYWAAGSILVRFLITTVLDPRLDVRYPLSQPSSGRRGRACRRSDEHRSRPSPPTRAGGAAMRRTGGTVPAGPAPPVRLLSHSDCSTSPTAQGDAVSGTAPPHPLNPPNTTFTGTACARSVT